MPTTRPMLAGVVGGALIVALIVGAVESEPATAVAPALSASSGEASATARSEYLDGRTRARRTDERVKTYPIPRVFAENRGQYGEGVAYQTILTPDRVSVMNDGLVLAQIAHDGVGCSGETLRSRVGWGS